MTTVQTKDKALEGVVRWGRYQDEPDAKVPAEFYKNAQRCVFTVWAEMGPGQWVDVWHGNDEATMSSKANFWDERVNVHIIDSKKISRTDLMWLGLFHRIDNDPTYGQK